MIEYSQDVHTSAVAYPPNIVPHPLGEVISMQGLYQLRLSETEKERFVTYYFNGQRESPFIGEDRIIIPSPKVATYDMKPEMASYKITEVLIDELNNKKYDFILINFACPDMVAHTGIIPATIKACETVDLCLAKIVPLVLKLKGTVFITGDHGNAEELINPVTGSIDTEHSTFPVPFIAVNSSWEGMGVQLPTGILADVATTILEVMQISKPVNMTGRNLLENMLE